MHWHAGSLSKNKTIVVVNCFSVGAASGPVAGPVVKNALRKCLGSTIATPASADGLSAAQCREAVPGKAKHRDLRRAITIDRVSANMHEAFFAPRQAGLFLGAVKPKYGGQQQRSSAATFCNKQQCASAAVRLTGTCVCLAIPREWCGGRG
jgi:hypothetical protein